MTEHDWERRIELPTLDEVTLRDAIGAHVDEPVERITPMAGGKVNAHVRADLADGRAVVLRIHLRDPMAAPKERALLGLFAGRIPLPTVLGHGTCELEGLPHAYLVLDWLAGATLDRQAAAMGEPALARAGVTTGRAMATVHAEAREDLGFLDAQLRVSRPMEGLHAVWTGTLDGWMARPAVTAHLGPERVRTLRSLMRAEGAQIAAFEGDYAIQHGDCKPTNVRVALDGEVTGLLDWEFAWSGPRLFDWGQMLRWPLPPAFEAGLIEGYEAAGGGRPLDGAGRRTAALLDVMNLLAFLDVPGGATRERVVRDVLALLDATLGEVA